MNDIQAFEQRTSEARQRIGKPPVEKYRLRPYNNHAGYLFRMFREVYSNDKALWRDLNTIVSRVSEDIGRRERLQQWLEEKKASAS